MAAVAADLRTCGLEVVQQIIWDKELFVIGRQHYHWQHEPCFYARRQNAKVAWYGGHNQSTVWKAASPKMVSAGSREQKYDHPTQKPVALFTRPIENHLLRGEVVYDPFVGSGTALIAAEMTGRVCYAMELDPLFCDVARQRYEQRSGVSL